MAYLTNAVHPQGFSPSRRFDPDVTSRLYFAPHPPVGFAGLESFSHPQQPTRLSTLGARSPRDRAAQFSKLNRAAAYTVAAFARRQAGSRVLDEARQTRTSELCSGRASDTPHHAETWQQAAAPSTFFPLRGKPSSIVGPKPSPRTLEHIAGSASELAATCSARGASGYQSDRVWGGSRGNHADPHEVSHFERASPIRLRRIYSTRRTHLSHTPSASSRSKRRQSQSPSALGAEP